MAMALRLLRRVFGRCGDCKSVLKTFVVCLAAVLMLVMQGCNAGVVTSQQQQDKAAALNKYAKDHANEGPPHEERPSQ